MQRLNRARAALAYSLRKRLPDHRFTWHNGDRETVIILRSAHQLSGLGMVVALAAWLGISTIGWLGTDNEALAVKEQQLAALSSELAAVRSEAQLIKGDVAQRAELLEARQEFLTAILSGEGDAEALAALLPRKLDADNGSIEAMMPPLKTVEAQQLLLVDQAMGAAQAKMRGTEAMIRKLGLNPKRFAAASDWRASAIGGPFVPATEELEPRFTDFYASWRKLEDMQAAMASIPALVPVKNYRLSSRYGRRYDPFNGRIAQHAGLDLAGSRGEPIYAAADGRITRAGRMSGYGTMAEINHGKGMSTRYGHMSLVLVKPGQRVKQGDMIGRMGSTGRSTGTHLHYEIRVDGRAINPKPFIDASPRLLAAQRDGETIALASAAPAPAADSGVMMTPIPPLG
ncbi:MAG: peptidoglycan DD-metalloendopeptidase family protein [Polymorphobacter sp.]|uniref:M23 family metallopeptidase n=1 Tax=Polymorphobacter sp. TaxID=1909290 RepID=UPI003A87B39C